MTRRSVLAAVLTLSAGCVRNPRKTSMSDDGTAQRYHLQGTVVGRDETAHTVTIKHGKIVNDAGKVWMEPMTMEFPVPGAEDFAKLTVGKEVGADVLSRSSDLQFWIERVQASGQ